MQVTEPKFMKALEKKLTEIFNEQFGQKNVRNILDELHITVNSTNQKTTLLKTIENFTTRISKTISEKDFDSNMYLRQQDFENLDNILEVIAQTVKIIEGDNGGLAAILSQLTSQPYFKTYKQLGDTLDKRLQEYQAFMANVNTIDGEILKKAANSLQNFAKALQRGGFNTKKDGQKVFNKLTHQGSLKTLISNNFISNTLAQNFARKMVAEVYEVLGATMQVGSKKVSTSQGTKTRKTDFIAKNLKINFQETQNGPSYEITMSLGISSKFYVSQSFVRKNKVGKGTITSGRGPSLEQSLKSIFGEGHDEAMYFAYNFIAHSDEQKDQFHGNMNGRLNNLILKKEIMRLLATAGNTSDFSQFLLVNGKLYSMYEIIQYVINEKNNFYLTSYDRGFRQGIYLQIDARKNLKNKNQWDSYPNEMVAAWHRSHELNETIRRSSVSARIHMQSLVKAISQGGKIPIRYKKS